MLFGLNKVRAIEHRFLSVNGIESGRLRTGRLQQDEWGLLGYEIDGIREVPLFVCDKGSIKVKEMLSKV